MQDSIFTKIINKELPGTFVYEDDQCVVIMTIEPLSPGHCLVVPRTQIDHLWDIDNVLYQHIMLIAKQVATAMRTVYDYPRIGMLVEGFGVPHAHVHVIGLREGFEQTILHRPTHPQAVTADELAIEANKLREQLKVNNPPSDIAA